MNHELSKGSTVKKKKEEPIVTGPIRKSRRLMGEKPEFIIDEFDMRESHPYIPPQPEKEKLMEIEGTIVAIRIMRMINSPMMVISMLLS